MAHSKVCCALASQLEACLDPTVLNMTIKLKDYVPPILFAVCVGYALFAVDNLEFYEQKKFQRRLSVGLRVLSSFGFRVAKGLGQGLVTG